MGPIAVYLAKVTWERYGNLFNDDIFEYIYTILVIIVVIVMIFCIIKVLNRDIYNYFRHDLMQIKTFITYYELFDEEFHKVLSLEENPSENEKELRNTIDILKQIKKSDKGCAVNTPHDIS